MKCAQFMSDRPDDWQKIGQKKGQMKGPDMDLLTDVLNTLELKGWLSSRRELTSPWRYRGTLSTHTRSGSAELEQQPNLRSCMQISQRFGKRPTPAVERTDIALSCGAAAHLLSVAATRGRFMKLSSSSLH